MKEDNNEAKAAKQDCTYVSAHTRKKNANRPKQYTGAMKVSKEALIEAAEKAQGIVSYLATLLRIDNRTVKRYLDLVPEAKKAFESGREIVIDKAESELLRMAFDRNNPRQFDAILFLLKTIGKTRGFTEKTETEVKSNQPIVIQLDADDAKG